jgi:gamma-glutamyl-gamma-aminobutyrate hydrolase PuuD
MIIVVLTPDDGGNSQVDLESLKSDGVDFTTVGMAPGVDDAEDTLNRAGGLFVGGDGSNTSSASPNWHAKDLEVVRKALKLDMPVLATGYGMLLLNQAFGGKPAIPVTDHGSNNRGNGEKSASHSIYLSPGSKSAATLGLGGFFKVNSSHIEGLFDLQRAPRLLASAYSVEDGVVEGLESPEHSWVIGFQANIERQAESPRAFNNIFLAFFERAEHFSKSRSVARV